MMMVTREQTYFQDRTDAGRQLSERLLACRGNCVVLAVPNGGIPLAIEVARRLDADLDVVVIRKLQALSNSESGYGAVASDGSVVYNRPMVKKLSLNDREITKQAAGLKEEISKRNMVFRGDRPFPSLVGKAAIIVDDGLASGYTMAAAVKSVRNLRAGKIVVAVPVAPEPAYQIVKSLSDEVVCPIVSTSSWFAVSSFYRDWDDLTDADALALLTQFRSQRPVVLARPGAW
ncbi:MAG: phosphoribosyltransferase family protein [Dehalococcoidia bacterium]|nr:phosphoribosyltransferase family protein [Dehalococcoidia bacterium]